MTLGPQLTHLRYFVAENFGWYATWMIDHETVKWPAVLPAIEADTKDFGFDMPSERRTGALLRTLVASKPNGRMLELGTGTGLATAWLLDGMDERSTLTSVDLDKAASEVASRYLGHDPRLTLVVDDANIWLRKLTGRRFDLIFADAMPGKYENFDLAWRTLSVGGFYVIDDMLPQANWPEGHAFNVERLLRELEQRTDCWLVQMSWGTGLVLVVRIQ